MKMVNMYQPFLLCFMVMALMMKSGYESGAYYHNQETYEHYNGNNINEFIGVKSKSNIHFFKSFYLLIKQISAYDFNNLIFSMPINIQYNDSHRINSNLVTNVSYYRADDSNYYMDLKFNHELLLELIEFYKGKLTGSKNKNAILFKHFYNLIYAEISSMKEYDGSNKLNYNKQKNSTTYEPLNNFENTNNEFYKEIDDYKLKAKLMYGSSYEQKLDNILDLLNNK